MKNKKTMIITLSIFALLLIIIIIGKIILSVQFNKQVKKLFSQSKNISNQTFNYNQLLALPEPVQRYFKHALKDGQPYISYVNLTHDGQFKTGQNKDWVNIKGEQYFTTQNPGFIWKGTTSLFTARDMYIADKGRLVVSLLSLINVVDGKGEKYNEGELQRWLSESVWFPTNLLPGGNVKWSVIDANSAKLSFNYKNISFFHLVTFNEIGEIVEMETERYMTDDKRETWVGKFKDYKEINSIIIPTDIEAIYRLAKGDYSYAKFKVKKIEYGKPVKF